MDGGRQHGERLLKGIDMKYRIIAVLPLLFAFLGCSDSPADHNAIRGEVKVDGQPIERGMIMFVPLPGAKGQTAAGPIKDGKYDISAEAGPTVGTQRVEIHSTRKTGKKIQKAFAPKGEMVDEEGEGVAKRFNSASKLTTDVKAGENVANFQVESK